MGYETLSNDLTLVLFEEMDNGIFHYSTMSSSRTTLYDEDICPMDEGLPTIHLMHKHGIITIVHPRLGYWTGSDFKSKCKTAYGMTDKFYLDGWIEMLDNESLYKQWGGFLGLGRKTCFVYYEDVTGMKIDEWATGVSEHIFHPS